MTAALPQNAGVSSAVDRLVDDAPMSAFQIRTVLFIAAAVVLDGLDNQMLGLAAPSLIEQFGVSRDALGVVFALGFVGMMLGTLAAGSIGDRFGRRGALIGGVVVFGVGTLLTGFAQNFWQVGALKVIAGIGLGGVPGTASAMIAEFTPSRWRSVAVTFGVVCVSIGGILGSVAAALILPELGWRWLFWIGGMATLVFTVLVAVLLPESPGYLATRPKLYQELAALLQRMKLPPLIPEKVALEPKAESWKLGVQKQAVPFSTLLRPPLLHDSIALSIAMFSGMFMIYLMFNWAPTLLFSAGYSLETASLGLTSFNIGGTIGAMLASFAIIRFGSRAVLIVLPTTAAAVCAVLAVLPMGEAAGRFGMLTGLGALGLFGTAAQSAMFAVGANAFPTSVRGRGLGLMGAAGRAGAILSALAGAMLIGNGNAGFFGTLVVLMLVNSAGLAAVRNHVPRLRRPLQASEAILMVPDREQVCDTRL